MRAMPRIDRATASATESPAPTPAPPSAPQTPPMTARTGITAIGSVLPGTAVSRKPPAAPASIPATPPPVAALTQRTAIARPARRRRNAISSSETASGAGEPSNGTSAARAESHRVSRRRARAAACPGRSPNRRSVSAVPNPCSNSAASRRSSSSVSVRVTRSRSGSNGSCAAMPPGTSG